MPDINYGNLKTYIPLQVVITSFLSLQASCVNFQTVSILVLVLADINCVNSNVHLQIADYSTDCLFLISEFLRHQNNLQRSSGSITFV